MIKFYPPLARWAHFHVLITFLQCSRLPADNKPTTSLAWSGILGRLPSRGYCSHPLWLCLLRLYYLRFKCFCRACTRCRWQIAWSYRWDRLENYLQSSNLYKYCCIQGPVGWCIDWAAGFIFPWVLELGLLSWSFHRSSYCICDGYINFRQSTSQQCWEAASHIHSRSLTNLCCIGFWSEMRSDRTWSW